MKSLGKCSTELRWNTKSLNTSEKSTSILYRFCFQKSEPDAEIDDHFVKANSMTLMATEAVQFNYEMKDFLSIDLTRIQNRMIFFTKVSTIWPTLHL